MYSLALAARQTHTGRLGPTVARCALPTVSNAAANASASLVPQQHASGTTATSTAAHAHSYPHIHALQHPLGSAATTGIAMPGLSGIGNPKTGFRSRFGWSRWRRRRLHTTAVRRDDANGGGNRTDGLGGEKRVPLRKKLAHAWRTTPTTWYPLPIFVGALLLVAIDFRKRFVGGSSSDARRGEKKDEDVRLKGPWHVHVLGALPLRSLSRLWGTLNSLELPVWFRPYGFKFYAFIFGCNLDEIEPSDLKTYRSLGEFFYRRLKDGARVIDKAPLVSPADGRVLHFGTVEGVHIEQVKGLTYSLDALLGKSAHHSPTPPTSQTIPFANRDHEIVNDQEFANVNGIDYTLDQLFGSKHPEASMPCDDEETPLKFGEQHDASVPHGTDAATIYHDASVALAVGPPPLQRTDTGPQVHAHTKLFFTVIYLAPGDYHRFHSPAAWVVERRRHFAGELFSVSPWMARRLKNLFVLNERVALLGRWRHGFFGMVPVGATNVGSIILNFDRELRTNVHRGRARRTEPGTYVEAVYTHASSVLRGQPLRPGEEMGGFCLGSTVVLVFEAPRDFEFDVKAGEKVKVGQRLGDVRKEG